jgi:8-oxo-dGTP diphosphatase
MAYFWKILARVWRLGGRSWRWRVLWLVNPTFIVGVTGVLLDGEGKVLLLRHRFWRAGSWGLPSGMANRGETLEEAFAREVREETALEIGDIRLVRLVSGFRLRLECHFAARLTGGTLALDGREILEARFFTPNNLPDGLMKEHRETVRMALGA